MLLGQLLSLRDVLLLGHFIVFADGSVLRFSDELEATAQLWRDNEVCSWWHTCLEYGILCMDQIGSTQLSHCVPPSNTLYGVFFGTMKSQGPQGDPVNFSGMCCSYRLDLPTNHREEL